MLKDIKLPEPLLEFIESTKQRLLADVGTEYVDYGVELVWTDMIYPSYTWIIFCVQGSDEIAWRHRCHELEDELNDEKPESLFNCISGPRVLINCYNKGGFDGSAGD